MNRLYILFYAPVCEYQARKEEFDRAVQDVFEGGDFILGEDVASFEKETASLLRAKYAVDVASGSDTLVIGSDIRVFRDVVARHIWRTPSAILLTPEVGSFSDPLLHYFGEFLEGYTCF